MRPLRRMDQQRPSAGRASTATTQQWVRIHGATKRPKFRRRTRQTSTPLPSTAEYENAAPGMDRARHKRQVSA
jgi:hypothetical protein